jgi:hypothetical protein
MMVVEVTGMLVLTIAIPREAFGVRDRTYA